MAVKPTELLVVDGYNIAHAWAPTKALLRSRAPLEDTRRLLVGRLASLAAMRTTRVVVVFDAPRRGTAPSAEAEVVDGVEIRYGGGAYGSADHLIERLVYEALRVPERAPRVRVASDDRLVRDMVRAMGAETLDAAALGAEVTDATRETDAHLGTLATQAHGAHRVERRLPPAVREHLESIRRDGQGASPGVPPPRRPSRVRDRFRPFDPDRDLGDATRPPSG